MMITVAFLLVLPAFTFSQAIIRNETSPVCSLQLSDSISKTAIERTNDWTITPWTSYTLWPAAKFFFTRDGELYGNNGQFCSFSRMYTHDFDLMSDLTNKLSMFEMRIHTARFHHRKFHNHTKRIRLDRRSDRILVLSRS